MGEVIRLLSLFFRRMYNHLTRSNLGKIPAALQANFCLYAILWGGEVGVSVAVHGFVSTARTWRKSAHSRPQAGDADGFIPAGGQGKNRKITYKATLVPQDDSGVLRYEVVQHSPAC